MFTVNDQGTGKSNIMNTTATDWWFFTNETILDDEDRPPVQIVVQDSTNGSPLSLAASSFARQGPRAVSFNTDRVDDHQILYNITGGDFDDNGVATIDLTFGDQAGHETEGDLRVAMDVTDPEVILEDDASTILQQWSESSPAVPGEALRVHVNATDIAGQDHEDEDVFTPPEFLKVEAQLFSYTGPILSQQWVELEFDPAESDDEEGHFFNNLTIPDQWASGNTSAVIRITDPVGNQEIVTLDTNVTVKADLPRIEPVGPVGPGGHTEFSADEDVEFRIRAWDPVHPGNWTEPDVENGTGIDFDTVRLHYRVGEDGELVNRTLSDTDTEDTFRTVRSFGELEPVYFYFSAADHAGNVVRYPGSGDPSATTIGGRPYLLLHTDRVGPDITPPFDLSYIGGPGDHQIAFNVTEDPGVGVDPATVVLHWRPEGGSTYEDLDLAEGEVVDPFTGETYTSYVGEIPEQDEDGLVIQYYVTASDKLGNDENLGSPSNPRSSELDLSPPTVTVTSPETSSNNTFEVTWEGEDEKSGVRDFSLQFRIGSGNWIDVPDRQQTTLTAWDVCAATDVVYEFRVSARDIVGNVRAYPEVRDAATQITAEDSCVDPPEVFLNAPADGATLSGEVDVEWNAISTVFGDQLTVRIEIDGITLVDGLAHEGTHTWNTARYNAQELDQLCFPDGDHTLSVVAVDPAGMESPQDATVTLNNGRDSCEPQAGTTNGPNLLEDFDPLYLLVVLAFIGLIAVFAVGMARRW